MMMVFDMNSQFISNILLYASPTKLKESLKKLYQSRNLSDLDSQSYYSAQRISTFLHHGISFWEDAKHCSQHTKGVFYFYGLVQFAKALVILNDPLYPKTNQCLAHGLSLKKTRSKEDMLIHQSVKVQANGLYARLCEDVYHVPVRSGDYFSLLYLFQHIPSLQPIVRSFTMHSNFIPVDCLSHTVDVRNCAHSNLTFFNEHTSQWEISILDETLPELLVYFMISYSLSMFSRYEADWWIALNEQSFSDERNLIQAFYSSFQHKVPILIQDLLRPILNSECT
ncbi:MAG: YaaC family protein [Bacilli bacterium]